MFDAIIAAFEGLWNILRAFLQAVFDWFKPSFLYVISAVVTLFAVLGSVCDWINSAWSLLNSEVVKLSAPITVSLPTIPADTLALMNTIFPLDEAFRIMEALFVLWIAALVYRVVKSWIPMLS